MSLSIIERLLAALVILGVLNTCDADYLNQRYIQRIESQTTLSQAEEVKVENGYRYSVFDQLDWTGREYAKGLYARLEWESRDDGLLINPITVDENGKEVNSCVLKVITITGKAKNQEDMEAQMNEKLDEVRSNIIIAYKAFLHDHPEVFWLQGRLAYIARDNIQVSQDYSYKMDILFGIKTPKLDMIAEKYQDVDKLKKEIEIRDKLVAEFIRNIPKDAKSRYDILMYFNKELCNRNEYNTSSDLLDLDGDCYQCISALKGQKGTEGPVCGAYTNALKVLCDEVNIPCEIVIGDTYVGTTKTGRHAWNYVQMEDGNWYAIDLTWNDSESIKPVYERWFLLGSDTKVRNEEFKTTHVEDTGIIIGQPITYPELNTNEYIKEEA